MQKVIIVHLRRPSSKAANPKEMRSDPFWEFGSFGLTGCHHNNLMQCKNAKKLNGVRFAFAQGGKQGTKLVHLTPPVRIKEYAGCIEARWSPHAMPFRYDRAPVLASNSVRSNFSQLGSIIESVQRLTREGQFSSKFRSRAIYIPDELANELIDIYEKMRRKAKKEEVSRYYEDALPWRPPHVDKNRKQTYTELRAKARKYKSRRVCGNRGYSKPSPTTARRNRPC